MCGVYHIDEDNAELIRVLSSVLSGVRANTALKTGDIYPGDIAPVLTNDRPAAMRWGFSLEGRPGRIINARCETVLEKPLFKPLVQASRCAIPASRYYEWETLLSGRKKYAIAEENDELIYLAGLFRLTCADLPEFVVLTRSPQSNIAFIHDRMPLTLNGEERDEWLFSPNAANMLENVRQLGSRVRCFAADV